MASVFKDIDSKFELQHIAARGIKVWPAKKILDQQMISGGLGILKI